MILRNLMPVPAQVETAAGELHFGAEVTLRVNAPLLTEGMIEEYRGLWNRYGMRLAALRVVRDGRLEENCAVLAAADIACPALAPGDEYALTVTESGAFVRGESAVGLLHGLFTLVQLVVPIRLEGEADYAMPAVRIHDRPAIRGMRAIHLCVFPETTLLLLEKAIRLAGMMKFTHVVLEFWGMLRYDTLPELAWPRHAYSKEQIRPLVRLIQDLGMEVIPMLNHLGHAAQCRSCYGKHVVLDQNPARALLFEPDGWTWCISNPETRRVLRGLRQELIDLCGSGKYFHLGCDESYSYATCPICSTQDTRRLESLEQQVAALTDENQSLLQQLAQLELAKQEPAEPKATAATVEELEAYRRAERVERTARERAKQIGDRTAAVLGDAGSRVDGAAQRINEISNQILEQLNLLKEAMTDSHEAFEDASRVVEDLYPQGE